ncbi:hypothetical protein K438DRAFT_612009 [Mycena galopus ATCC 62051]|nr:hypothetical protein K438DRAFT_612009 [Mycena galopus ATCC 62051]
MDTPSSALWMESLCLSGLSSNVSLLATPELTPPSSGSEDSCFSSVNSLHPTVDIVGPHEPIVDSPVRETRYRGLMEFASKILGSPPSSPTRRQPRMRKSLPHLPKLSLDPPILGSSEAPSSLPPPSLRRRLITWPSIFRRPSTQIKISRRSALSTFPTAPFYSRDKRNRDVLRGMPYEHSHAAPVESIPRPMRRLQSLDPDPSIENANTQALVSLAWTGQIPSSSNSDPSSISLNSVLLTPRSEFLESASSTWGERDENTCEAMPVFPRPRAVSGLPSPSVGYDRPWSLATAIISDEITDEMFVDELELMRMKGSFLENRPLCGYASSPTLNLALPPLADPLLSATWPTARRALLTCRELIRTERNYLALLLILVSNGTATPPPPLIMAYTPALIEASQNLLLKLTANPSVQGIAETFIEAEPSLEAFVAWCGVSGDFFLSPQRPTIGRTASSSVRREMDSPIVVPLKRRVTTWVQERRSSYGMGREGTMDVPSSNPSKGRSLPSVRDLAILPIQRVMRYVLLFRDLSANVPATSPSYVFVERALQVAMVIAQKSDRAQGNAAFLRWAV